MARCAGRGKSGPPLGAEKTGHARARLQSERRFPHDCPVGRFFRYFGIGIGVLLALLVILFLAYYLPASTKVHVTGTEVKRMDVQDETGSTRTRDVRFIFTRDIESEKTMVFRNEDTGWGWPPYFKFNSGDVMGEAVGFADTDENEVVLVTYYGFRLTLLDMYPNVLSLERVSRDYTHVPVFNIVFIIVLVSFVGFAFFRVRRWTSKRRGSR